MLTPAQVTTTNFIEASKPWKPTEDSDRPDYINLGYNDQPATYSFQTGPGIVRIHAQGGDDIITLTGNGEAWVDLGSGNDRLFGSEGRDSVSGGTGNDVILGNGGNDRLNGNSGNDIVQGGSGEDWLFGETGNDTLYGGTGKDFMWGGAGADTFVFDRSEDEVDMIRDFQHGEDKIDLRALSVYGSQYPGNFLGQPEVRIVEKFDGFHVLVDYKNDGQRVDLDINVACVGGVAPTMEDILI